MNFKNSDVRRGPGFESLPVQRVLTEISICLLKAKALKLFLAASVKQLTIANGRLRVIWIGRGLPRPMDVRPEFEIATLAWEKEFAATP